ncbi:unnamed protein product [Brassica rapa subsp. trilocularis]
MSNSVNNPYWRYYRCDYAEANKLENYTILSSGLMKGCYIR